MADRGWKVMLTSEEKITKEGLYQTSKTFKYSIGGQLIVLLLIAFLLSGKISLNIILSGFILHIMILFGRGYSYFQYNKNMQMVTDSKSLSNWLSVYQIGAFLTGLAWGMILFFTPGLPAEYYFFIYAIIYGLTASAVLTLGTVFPAYIAFMLPILVISLVWMMQQNGLIYTISSLMIILLAFYYFFAARRFSQNFRQIFMERMTIEESMVELEKKNRALQKSEKLNRKLNMRMALALAGSNTSVLEWDFTESSVYISPSWKEMLGFGDAELSNSASTWNRRVHRDDMRTVYLSLKKHIAEKKKYFENTHRLKHKDGHWIWILARAQILYDVNGKAVRMVGTHTDITERKIAEEKLFEQKNILDHQAHHDLLTELPNRILFNDRLNQGIEKAKREKMNLALLFIDLDHFKQINDTLGHEIGDRVLRVVALRLEERIRKVDTLARLGGDEFGIIMENLAKVEDASRLAQKILETLKQPVHVDDYELYVSGSIGISLYPKNGENAHNLLKYADTAMYQAKDEGRNNFQFYSVDMTEVAFQRVAMEVSLRQALKNEEFVAYYQPQIDASSEKIVGMEALVRWNRPFVGFVSPADFIPLAEETGLIIEIDRLMMKMAMQQVSRWYKEGLEPGVLALNLAMKQLKQDDFLQMIQDNFEAFDFKPEWLEFEITEGDVMQKPEEAINKLKQISDLGIGIAIDDFGTGYSSLSYLKRLPIDKLKIDQSFIRDIPDDEEDVAIVKAIIALAESLNLDLLGEGVETDAQKEFLLTNGCKKIQGYYYSRAVSSGGMKIYMENRIFPS